MTTIAKCCACGYDVIMKKSDYVTYNRHCGACHAEVLELHTRTVKDATHCRRCEQPFVRTREGYTNGTCRLCSLWAAEHYRAIMEFARAAASLPECARCRRRVKSISDQDLCEDCAKVVLPCQRCLLPKDDLVADVCGSCWDELDEIDSRRRNHKPVPIYIDDEAEEASSSSDSSSTDCDTTE